MNKSIDIKTQDGLCDTYISYPKEEGSYPAVLFLMDGFGPRPWLYQMADTIAAQGYYVLLPNLFYRIRRAPVVEMKSPLKPEDMPEISQKLIALIQSYKYQAGLQDIGTFFDFLSKQKQVKAAKINLIGYCMGGSIAIRAAALYAEQIRVVASFHAGRLATDAPDSPHLLLNHIKARLYIGHADNDKSMPPEQIELLENTLSKTSLQYKTELYKGVAHGFTMADLPAYNEAALQQHWDRLFDLLQ